MNFPLIADRLPVIIGNRGPCSTNIFNLLDYLLFVKWITETVQEQALPPANRKVRAREMKTIRQQLIEALMDRKMTAIDLSQEVGIGEKEVYEHLPHIARSVASQGNKVAVEPPRCLKCGFVFEGRKRFTRPGRCPKCRETHIQNPSYAIRRR
ncbi:MAG: transcriptional regulator [Thermodesulfobacteriota bacterium]|nr:transcriptional regulator [Thermodesulfobacteriota bacterium]